MLRSVSVRDYMLKKPVIVSPDTPLFDAIHKILVNKISGITVVDTEGRVVGVLSELDALKAILAATYYHAEASVGLVESYMTTTVETVHPEDNIVDVAQSIY